MILKKMNPKARKAYFLLQKMGFKTLSCHQRQVIEKIKEQGYEWDEDTQEWYKNSQ
jgi:hypothetical protein